MQKVQEKQQSQLFAMERKQIVKLQWKTGVVLGIGRALGEAMAINMVAGGSVNIPLPFNSVRFLTTQIVSEMSYAEGLHREVLFTVGLVLFVFIMIINLILAQVEKRGAVEQ